MIKKGELADPLITHTKRLEFMAPVMTERLKLQYPMTTRVVESESTYKWG